MRKTCLSMAESHRGKFTNKRFIVIAAVTSHRAILTCLPYQMDSPLFISIFGYILIFIGHEDYK